MDYKTWYNKIGFKLEEDLRIWIESCPIWFNEIDLFGDIDTFVQGELEAQYEGYLGDINDRMYQEWKDDRV